MPTRWFCCLMVVGAIAPVFGQQPSQNPRTYPAWPIGRSLAPAGTIPTPTEPLPWVAPIFIEDEKTSSSVVIINDSGIKAGASIAVRDLSGRELVYVHRPLAPHEQQEIAVSSLLASVVDAAKVGSITVTQDPELKGMTVASQLLLTSHSGTLPSYVDEELAMTDIDGSAVLHGVADHAIGSALIAVSSIVKWPQQVTVRCIGQGAERRSAAITLRPQATVLIANCSGQTVTSLESYEQSVAKGPSERIEAYEIATDGGPGAIAAFGLASHHRGEAVLFSGVPFTDPKKINSPNSVFAGVPFGTQPTLPDGVYTPRISLANFATTPAHVTISVATTPPNSDPGSGPEKRILRELTIAPRRATEFTVEDAGSQSGLLQSLIVESDRKPGEVVGKVVSRSDGNLFEVELLGKDQMDENNGGIHPWSTEGDADSHLLLFNYSSNPRVFGVGISNGAIVWDRKYTLAPYETREISINELILDRVKDGKGQVLRPDLQRGAVNWMVPDSGEGTGRLMVTSHSRALARNFSCGNFIVVCGSQVTQYINAMTEGETTQVWIADPQFCDEFSPSQCTGGSYVASGSASYSWNIGASTVIRPNTNPDQYAQSPYVYAVGPGVGGGFVQITAGGCQSGGSGGGECTPPKVTFSTLQGIAQGSSTTVSVDFTNATSSCEPITLKLSTTSGTGAATFVSGGTVAADHSSTVITTPTPVVIQGVTASSTAGNILLDATANKSDGSAGSVATNPQSFSVVNVSLSLLHGGTIPSAYPYTANLPSASLDPQIYPPDTVHFTQMNEWACVTPYLVTGTVTPANYPGPITLRRKVLGGDLYTDPNNTPTQVVQPHQDDGYLGTYTWNMPSQKSGKIYDWDAPGILETDGSAPTGQIQRLRVNANEYAVIGDFTSSVTVGNSLPLYWRASCAKLATGVKLDTTYSGDNTVGSGTTTLSRTLQ